jgi:hypothetical protein
VSAETRAAVLKAAADKLRKLLAHPELTPGPWLSMDHGDRLLWDGPGAEDLPPRYVVDEPMSNAANAAFIAALGPGVGEALAHWLTDAATIHVPDSECGYCIPARNPLKLPCPALAVARAVLGEDAPAAPSDVEPRQDAR